jgi:hypothetical protein
MQIFIDLDLREAINSPGDRSLISAIQCSSQDTLEMDVYFARGGNLVNPGPGVALKYGLFAAGQTTALALQTAFALETDPATGNVFYQGLVDFNTAEMASAIQNVSSLACNGQLRYQLADGEIIHTVYLPFSVFPALLQETGTPPPAPANTYPDVSQLVLVSQKGAPSGVAELDSSGKANPAEMPIDGQTIVLSAGKLSVPIDGLSLTLQAGKLAVNVDGQSIVLNNGVLESGLVLTTFKAAWQTPAAGADVDVQVNDSSKLKTGQNILVPLAGYYTVKTITDLNNIVITNASDPFNVGAGVTIVIGTVILPAQLTPGSGGGTVTLAIGTVSTLTAGSPATASISGTAPNYLLNLGIPAGQAGTTPANPTLAIGSVSTLPAGSAATASITGTYPNFLLNLGIPAGSSGGGSGGGGLSSLTDAETTTGQSMIYDGSTGKLKRFAFDSLFNVTDQGTYWKINFPAYPYTQQSFTMPAVGSNTGSINIQNQGGSFLQPGMLIYMSGAGVLLVVSTATSGQDTAVFQNYGSFQNFTNAVAGATVAAGAWIEIIQQSVLSLTDATIDAAAYSLIGASTGKVKLIKIPSWLQPADTGTEIQINAPTPLGAGDMKVAVYDTITGTPTAIPAAQVDQARIIVQPRTNALRNFIDNGLFKVHQRGTFGTAVTAAGFQLDRWQYVKVGSGAGAFTLTYVENNVWAVGTDNPYTLCGPFLTVSTTAAPASGDAYLYQQYLEAVNTRDLVLQAAGAWNYWTLRFLVQASWSGVTYPMNLGVSFYNPVSGNCYVTDFQINSANVQEVIITIPADPSGNSQNLSPGTKGLLVAFALGAGSAYRATAAQANVWGQISQKYATPNSTDFVNITNAQLRITAVSLCVGRQPLKLWGVDYGEELRRCQRFYCKSCNLSQIPGASGLQANCGTFYTGAATLAYGNVRFPVDMYAAPTGSAGFVKVYDPVNGGASGSGYVGSGTITGLTPAFIGEKGFSQITGSGFTVGQILQVCWEASAEI